MLTIPLGKILTSDIYRIGNPGMVEYGLPTWNNPQQTERNETTRNFNKDLIKNSANQIICIKIAR